MEVKQREVIGAGLLVLALVVLLVLLVVASLPAH
jgi:hypothetical protein